MKAGFSSIQDSSFQEVVMTLNISVADDQLGAYYRKTAAIADRLGKSLRYEDVMAALQRIHDNDFEKPFVAQTVAEKPKKSSTVLAFREDLSVGPPTKRFVPNEFFITRPGLYLWNDMQRVLKDAKAVEPSEATAKLKSFDLTKKSYDKQIKAELPEHHEVELWEIAELIEAQKEGGDGPLLTNGYANIFYVAGFAVDVNWYADDRGWFVNAWELDDYRWGQGDRVFSSN